MNMFKSYKISNNFIVLLLQWWHAFVIIILNLANIVCDKQSLYIDLIVKDELMNEIMNFSHYNQPKVRIKLKVVYK